MPAPADCQARRGTRNAVSLVYISDAQRGFAWQMAGPYKTMDLDGVALTSSVPLLRALVVAPLAPATSVAGLRQCDANVDNEI